MVDAARQMLDELMGRHRNLDPSQAVNKTDWEDPEFCRFYNVQFCPHDLFINTRADLGPCLRLHDDEARRLYQETKPGRRKRRAEDEFLRFCNSVLHDVDRKINKGKQRLALMHRDNHSASVTPQLVSKYSEQISSLEMKIKKLVSEADEAGRRGDVDQARDLTLQCDELREEKEMLVAQYESTHHERQAELVRALTADSIYSKDTATASTQESPIESDENSADKKKNWIIETSTINEKQMKVCEICGAFLIIGDAQQRIEDHLTGKQHLGYTKLRKAVAEISSNRQRERDEEQRKRDEEFSRSKNYVKRDTRDERHRERSYNYSPKEHESTRYRDEDDAYRYHSSRSSKSSSRSHHHHSRRNRHSRSRSRTRSRSRSRSRSHTHSHSRQRSRY